MIYQSASHYYFWQGIEAGIDNILDNLYDHPETEPLFEGEVFIECVNSFIDGYLFGLAMSMSNYRNITEFRAKKKKEVKKVEKKTKALVPITDKNTYRPNIKGNC